MEVPPLEIKQYNLTMDGETVAVVYARNDITIWREDEREFTVRGSPEVKRCARLSTFRRRTHKKQSKRKNWY